MGGEGRLAAELAYTLIDHKKRRGNLVLNIYVLRYNLYLAHDMNMACTFVQSLVLRTFQVLAEN